MIKSGQRYQVNQAIPVICMTAWKSPYTGGHDRVLPEGEEFIIDHDPQEAATAVYATAVNYEKLHKVFVPWTDRIRFYSYVGYYLCIDLIQIEKHCSLVVSHSAEGPK